MAIHDMTAPLPWDSTNSSELIGRITLFVSNGLRYRHGQTHRLWYAVGGGGLVYGPGVFVDPGKHKERCTTQSAHLTSDVDFVS